MLKAPAVAIGVFLLTTSAMADPAKPPKDFITDAMKGDNSEMKLGQLAVDRGASEGTRSFGQMLVTDHTTGKQQATAVANSIGVTPTDDMMDAAMAENTKLNGLQGKAFDREFARYMVKDHKQDIAEFQAEADANNGQTSDLAKKTLPVLKKHLRTAERLASTGK